MASTDHAMGMMDAAYFTGRKDILEWINQTLALGVTKIETTCTGAIACQLIDAHFPGKVPMSKVNWEARNDYEYVNNYKVLQASFNKLNIEKKAEVEKLCRGKYQDNLEFMQWFKGFLDRHSVAEGYDPVERRSKGKGAARVEHFFGKAGTEVTTVKPRKCGVTDKNRASTSSFNGAPPAPPEKENHQPVSRSSRAPKAASSSEAVAVNAEADSAAILALQGKVTSLESTNGEQQLHIEGLEKERDFYFDKLREIEVLLQANEETNALTDSIFKILYHTTEDFVAVDDAAAPEDEATGEEA